MFYNQWQKSFPYSEHNFVSYSLMNQIFFRTSSLLLYPVLLSFSFFSYRALNNAFHCKYVTEFWICFKSWMERKYFYMPKCNNITKKFSEHLEAYIFIKWGSIKGVLLWTLWRYSCITLKKMLILLNILWT